MLITHRNCIHRNRHDIETRNWWVNRIIYCPVLSCVRTYCSYIRLTFYSNAFWVNVAGDAFIYWIEHGWNILFVAIASGNLPTFVFWFLLQKATCRWKINNVLWFIYIFFAFEASVLRLNFKVCILCAKEIRYIPSFNKNMTYH